MLPKMEMQPSMHGHFGVHKHHELLGRRVAFLADGNLNDDWEASGTFAISSVDNSAGTNSVPEASLGVARIGNVGGAGA